MDRILAMTANERFTSEIRRLHELKPFGNDRNREWISGRIIELYKKILENRRLLEVLAGRDWPAYTHVTYEDGTVRAPILPPIVD